VFAGVALKGATLRQDLDDNQALYAKKLDNREVVTSGIEPPPAATELLALLNRYRSHRKD
jgi:lipid-binding SYLF domain-containing protein